MLPERRTLLETPLLNGAKSLLEERIAQLKHRLEKDDFGHRNRDTSFTSYSISILEEALRCGRVNFDHLKVRLTSERAEFDSKNFEGAWGSATTSLTDREALERSVVRNRQQAAL